MVAIYWKHICLYIALLLTSIGLFDIHYNTDISKHTHLNSMDTVFVLDVSKSMNSLDVRQWERNISRLDWAKNIIKNMITQSPEHRYSLVIFAGEALSISPLQSEHSHILSILPSINYQNIYVQWSAFEKALEHWMRRINTEENKKNTAIIFLSDGGDDSSDSNYNSVHEAFKNY